jgi:hypothetical protein
MTTPARAFSGSTHARVSPRSLTLAAGAALAFLTLTGCEFDNVRPGADSIFTLFAEPTPAEAASWAIDRYDPDKRYRGTLLLSTATFASEPVYMDLFLDNIDDPDAGVRVVATRAVANHGGPEHVPLLVERLTDPDTLVRVEAARGLQRLHNPIAALPLVNALREPDPRTPSALGEESPDVRSEAAHALGQYPTPRVVQALITALGDSKLSVNSNALRSLRTLTGQDFGLDPLAWLQWLDTTPDLFAAGGAYVYPNYSRDQMWIEYLPFVGKPPNEPAATPAGLLGLPRELAATEVQPTAPASAPLPTPLPSPGTRAPTP